MDLSLDPLMIYYESAEKHTLVTWSSWTLSKDLISFPSMFQILMELSSDPLMMYFKSTDIQTLFTISLWALSIDLISFPWMFQIFID